MPAALVLWPLATHAAVVAGGMATQHPPPLHVAPLQHAWPGPPQATQEAPLQTSAPEHAPPLATHLSDAGLQHSVAAHTAPEQQKPGAAPHVTHDVPLHTWLTPEHAPSPPTQWSVPGSQQSPAVHVAFAQHGCPAAPHAAQTPAAHTSPPEHAVPDATHLPAPVSQQPLVHLVPSQHAAPVVPHTLASGVLASETLASDALASGVASSDASVGFASWVTASEAVWSRTWESCIAALSNTPRSTVLSEIVLPSVTTTSSPVDASCWAVSKTE